MEVGDLVNFTARSWVFNHATERYANPGIVISVECRHAGRGSGPRLRRFVATVYWSDGKITRETDSFLRPAVENKPFGM